MWRRPAIALFMSSALLVLISPSSSQESGQRGDAPSPEAVNRAIDAGIAWLKAKQNRDGSWGPCVADETYGGRMGGKCHNTGPTSFAVFTLAVCGAVKKSDRIVKTALKWLHDFDRDHHYTSYERSSIVLMLTALNEPTTSKKPAEQKGRTKAMVKRTKNRHKRPRKSRFTKEEWRWMGEHAEWLAASDGAYGYWGGDDYADVSATQFAILALRAASRAGYPVEQLGTAWEGAAKYLRSLQDTNGGFPYHEGKSWSAGMTAAGLSSLIICREQMVLLKKERPRWLDKTIEKAFAHLGNHFDPSENVCADRDYENYYHYCYLYAVERVGMLSGRRELGGKDWYIRGAKWLLEEQKKDGKWVDRSCMKPRDVLGTCFALLFLKRATVPALTPSDD